MNLAPLTEADLKDPDSVQEFADLNEITHHEIYLRMLELGLVLQHVPMGLDVADHTQYSDWAYIHDAEHRLIASQLGIAAPTDLSEFDFQQQDQFESWLAYHEQHHTLIAQALS